MAEQDFIKAGFTVVGTENNENKLLSFLKENYPNVIRDTEINIEELKEYWKELGNGFDVVYNLSGSIEEYLLKKQGTPEFEWSFEKRHGFCNVNYYDHTLNACGFEDKGSS